MTDKKKSLHQRDSAPQAASDLFTLLVNAVVDYAIFALDPNGYILTWNPGARRIKGYEAHEIIGSHFSRFYIPEDISRQHPQHELELAALNGTYEEEGWRVRKDGRRFWASVTITALVDADGELRGFGKVTRDLTDRRRAEEQLRESEERFRLIVEGVTDYAIFMLDPTGRVSTWNEGAARIKGYEAHEIIGRHFSIFYPLEDAWKPTFEIQQTLANGRFEDVGWRLRKDGSRFWASVVITAIRDKQGKLLGYSKVTRDLTDKKKAEDKLLEAHETLERRVLERTEQLARAKQDAEEAVKARDRFLSIASHELKTPLTSLLLQIQGRRLLLERSQDASAFSFERLWQIWQSDEHQVRRLDRLVDDMLDTSRLAMGQLSMKAEATDLCGIVTEVLNRFAPQLEAANMPLTFIAPRAVRGHWDPYRIEQVVTNILANAIKHGEGKPLRVEVAERGERARVAIRDQGTGIRREDQERIFQQFERVSSIRTVGGLGLGLFIAKEIVRAHGGKIWVESEFGQGAEVIFELPSGLSERPLDAK